MAAINRTVLLIDSGTVEQNSAIAVYAKARGWHFWTWVKNAWLLAGVPDDSTPRVIWGELTALPGMTDLKGLIFRLGPEPIYWGNNRPESWDWLAEYWGHAG